jgi:glycosyltransferase involved in cell wall biosynthesis
VIPPRDESAPIELALLSGLDPLRKVGGHESLVLAHALAARAMGLTPHLFFLGERSGVRESDYGVLHTVRSPVRPFRGFMARFHTPFLVRAIRRTLGSASGPVLLHAFGVWGFAAAEAVSRLRRDGRFAVSVTSAYTTLQNEYREKLTGLGTHHGIAAAIRHCWEYGVVRLLGVPAERSGYRRQSVILVNYESVERRIQSDYGVDVPFRRLPYAAPSAFARVSDLHPPPPSELSTLAPASAPLIVSLSRHDPRKGVDVLLQALRRLKGGGQSFRACLISDGPLLEIHRTLVERWGLSSSTLLPGRVEDPAAFLHQASIFVLPSIQECSGSLSLLEAMQAGCAVISSACDGMLEDLVDGDNALLVPPRDPVALSRALERLLSDEGLRARLAQRARATYLERFSAPGFVEALRATYDELVGRGGNGELQASDRSPVPASLLRSAAIRARATVRRW